MEIKILGTGCSNCQKLESNVRQAIDESGVDAKIEKITDMREIMNYGVMSLPAIVVDGEAVMRGMVPGVEMIKELLFGLNNESADNKKDKRCSCSCGC